MSTQLSAPTPLQSVVAGAAAGGVESLLTYPTEYVKTRKQLLSTPISPFRLLVTSIQSHGVGVLYSGAGAFCISNASKSGVRFLTFDTVRSNLPTDPATGKPTKTSTMLAGIAAGVAESITVVTPGESIKTRIVEDRAGAGRYKSTGAVIRSIASADGAAGFYRGVVPVTLKQGSNALVRFTAYHAILDIFRPVMEAVRQPALAPAVSGAAAGIITVYATMPFDTIKTQMQSSLQSGHARLGTWGAFSAMVQQSGIRGLWKGTTPRLIRLSVSPPSAEGKRMRMDGPGDEPKNKTEGPFFIDEFTQVSGALSFSIYEAVVDLIKQARASQPGSRGATM